MPLLLSEAAIPRNGVQFRLCHVEIPTSGLVRPSFKDSALILNRLPDASAYHEIQVSRSLSLHHNRGVEGRRMWVRHRDLPHQRKNCAHVSYFLSGHLLYGYQSYMISSSGGPSLISFRSYKPRPLLRFNGSQGLLSFSSYLSFEQHFHYHPA